MTLDKCIGTQNRGRCLLIGLLASSVRHFFSVDDPNTRAKSLYEVQLEPFDRACGLALRLLLRAISVIHTHFFQDPAQIHETCRFPPLAFALALPSALVPSLLADILAAVEHSIR